MAHFPFDLIKAGATQSETPLFKQYDAGERVDLIDASDHNFPARTITIKSKICMKKHIVKTNFRNLAQFTKFTKNSRVRTFVVFQYYVSVTIT